MHNSRGSVVRIFITKKINKIAANLKEVPRVSLPAKTIYGLVKKFRKTSFMLKEKRVRTQRFFSEETFIILECVQNQGHEIPLDNHKINPAYQSHCTYKQPTNYLVYTHIYLQL